MILLLNIKRLILIVILLTGLIHLSFAISSSGSNLLRLFEFLKNETRNKWQLSTVASNSGGGSNPEYPVTFNEEEIVNQTCIVDKIGAGYEGKLNHTKDGTGCSNWSDNKLLYYRYLQRGRNVTSNYCRNPDFDEMGPWCFVKGVGSRFTFKPCRIPICSKKTKPIRMAVPKLKSRKCPYGFKEEYKFLRKHKGTYFCVVESFIVHRLPQGSYSFILLDYPASQCANGFTLRETSLPALTTLYSELALTKTNNKTYLCIRNKNSSFDNSLMEFPQYIYPKIGDIVFNSMILRNNTSGDVVGCPHLNKSFTSTYYVHSSAPVFIYCYYFYKLNTGRKINNQLAFMTQQDTCPYGYIHFKSMNYLYSRGSVRSPIAICYSKYPSTKKYPNGTYCLLQLVINRDCPSEFIPVSLSMYSNTLNFCCRQTLRDITNNVELFNFFNVSSMLVLDTSSIYCKEPDDDTDHSVAYLTIETKYFNKVTTCDNCDLFLFLNQFSRYKKLRFYLNTCFYQIKQIGFGYKSIDSSCPTGMKLIETNKWSLTTKATSSSSLRPVSTSRFSRKYYSSANNKLILCIAAFDKDQLTQSNVNMILNSFPPGRYCIYKIVHKCPPKFKVNIFTTNVNFGYRYQKVNITYCCRMDNSTNTTNISTRNFSLPFITNNTQFGLPLPLESWNCPKGTPDHTVANRDSYCQFLPNTLTEDDYAIYLDYKCPYFLTYKFQMVHYVKNVFSSKYCSRHIEGDIPPPPGSYCIVFQYRCPTKYFNEVAEYILKNTVLCCRINSSASQVDNDDQSINTNSSSSKDYPSTLSDWTENSKYFGLFPDKQNKCPIFSGYNLGASKNPTLVKFTSYNPEQVRKSGLLYIAQIVYSRRTYKRYQMKYCSYTRDPYNNSVTWPHAKYGLLRPLSGCPPKSNFSQGQIIYKTGATPTNNNPTFSIFSQSRLIHLDYSALDQISWGFCVQQTSYHHGSVFFPYGTYCVFKVGKVCPYGFKSGTLSFLAGGQMSVVGTVPEIHNGGANNSNSIYTNWEFCCRSGPQQMINQPIIFPSETGPFYLLKYGVQCQAIKNMRYSSEHICIDTSWASSTGLINGTSIAAPYLIEGFTPVTGSFMEHCDLLINLCYYEKDIPDIIKNRTISEELEVWPKGKYGFIKVLDSKCPVEFEEVRILIQNNPIVLNPGFMQKMIFGLVDTSLDRDVTEALSIMSFCKRNDSFEPNANQVQELWPIYSNYCMIFEGNACPSGLLRFKLSLFDKVKYKSISGPSVVISHLCCNIAANLQNYSSARLPGDSYSILLPAQITECPRHVNMKTASININTGLMCIYEKIIEPTNDSPIFKPFPFGNYLFPALEDLKFECPLRFEKIRHIHTPIKPSLNQTDINVFFCRPSPTSYPKLYSNNSSSSMNMNAFSFPIGQYCVLTEQEVCPSTQFTQDNMLTIPNYKFLESRTSDGQVITKANSLRFSHYLACCQLPQTTSTNVITSSASLPLFKSNKFFFILYSNLAGCSFISDVKFTNLVSLPTPLKLKSGNVISDPKDMSPLVDNGQAMGICLYQSFSNQQHICQCHANARCDREFSSTKCRCLPGYYGDGIEQCVKLTNSTDNCGNLCNQNTSECRSNQIHSNSYSCYCKPGYKGNGLKCQPSCETRNCGHFAHCTVNKEESYCECHPDSVESTNGACYSDLLSSMAKLSDLPTIISRTNLSCFDSTTYDFIIESFGDSSSLSDESQIKYFVAFIPYDNYSVFSQCKSIDYYYSLHKAKIAVYRDIPWKETISTKAGITLQLFKNENNEWSFDKPIKLVQSFQFTNSLIFTFNQSGGDIFNSAIPSKSSKLISGSKAVTIIVLVTMMVLTIIIIGGFVIWRHGDGYRFVRLQDNQTESIINFKSETETVEME